jgi:hypothetical protein
MTAALDTYAPIAPTASLERLVNCSSHYLGSPEWWSRLAVAVDSLREQLAHADLLELSRQVVVDAPELAAAALRIPDLHDEAQAEAALLRMEIADRAGKRSEAIVVRESVKALVAHVRRVDRLSDDLLHDAYSRDFGGE